MRINPISYSPVAFKSRVKEVYSGEISKDIADRIDRFEENNREGTKKLGAGLFASVYLFNGTNNVIKESFEDDYAKEQNGNFFSEAKALSYIPENFDNAQKLVGHLKTENGNYYLVSTFVDGKAVKYPKKKWDKDSFSGLMDMAFNLDTLGVYHNDLNESNCLIDKDNKARAIDFQFAQKFDVKDDSRNDREFKSPSFMMPANMQMFEMASLPWYIRTMEENNAPKEEIRQIFKEYLEAKSNYCKKRAEYLDGIGGCEEKAEYERLQAKFYENPADEIINLEAKKLQVMYSFRKTFSLIDSNNRLEKNIYCAPAAYITTIKYAKDLADAADMIGKTTNDEDLKKFMHFEKSLGEYWQRTMADDLSLNTENGAWDWIKRNAKLKPRHNFVQSEDWNTYSISTIDVGVPKGEDIRKRLDAAVDLDMVEIKNVGAIITGEDEENREYDRQPDGYEKLSGLISKLQAQTEKLENKEGKLTPVEEFFNLKQKLIENDKKTQDSFNNKDFDALAANSIKTIYLGSAAKEKLKEIKDEDFTKFQNDLIDIDLRLEVAQASLEYAMNSANL